MAQRGEVVRGPGTRQRKDGGSVPNGPRGGLYSDHMLSNRTRSASQVKARLGARGGGIGKKQTSNDGKWAHDLYEVAQSGSRGRSRVSPGDLRLKLRNRMQGRKVVDLREKLLRPKVAVTNPKASQPNQRGIAVVAAQNAAAAALAEKAAAAKRPGAERGAAGQKAKSVEGLLTSLGLAKYILTFQREEVDWEALKEMTENDLKELGVPMGPRKKIVSAVKAGQ
eukprot:TRINITY_DN289_c0_g1_i1.p1 TRINITY_DN289_c0_g1~~TRINITY_DN289_c0_g1_i1.p1  ORF type:complete len:224 (-),score=51.97 TRINITY_DN289_c0_g1_i1:677-1348(-)